MKKSLLLISVLTFFFFSACHNYNKEKIKSDFDTLNDSTNKIASKDSLNPNIVGIGNSKVKDTSKHNTNSKEYLVPGSPDEHILDSIKNENDKYKKN